jgi:C1q domain
MCTLRAALFFFLIPACLHAQPAPLVGTTVTTLNTGATSLCVGGNTANTPTTCTGGAKWGPFFGAGAGQQITVGSPVSTVTLRPLALVGSDSATSDIVSSFYSNVSGHASVLHFSDANTYNVSLGANSAGAFTIWNGRSPGVAGTQIYTVNLLGTNTVFSPVTMTNQSYHEVLNTGGGAYFGIDNSTGSTFSAGNYASVHYTDSAGGIAIKAANAAGKVTFWTSSTEKMRLHASGGVSIGNTTDPSANNLSVQGRVQAVTQPGFLAYNSSSDTTQANGATIDFDTEVYDEAGNFAADTFTAPVTGRYLFNIGVRTSTGSATQDRAFALVTTARTYQMSYTAAVLSASINAGTGSVIADMTAGDTATVTLGVSTGTATVVGDATVLYTFFSGRLVP